MLKKAVLGVLFVFLFSGILIAGINFDLTKAVDYSGSGTSVGGYISENTTWKLDGSPYIVIANVIVEPYVYLTIDPGVLIKFKSGTSLILDGYLIAKGNSTHMIIFTSDSVTPLPGSWSAIVFRRDVRQTLEWVGIKFASTGISVENGEICIANSFIIQNNIGVSITGGSSVTIGNSSISHNTDNGLYVEKWLSTTVTAIVNLERVSITYNGGAGVSVGRSCIATVRQSAITRNNGDGIQSWLGTFENCYVLNSTIAENSGHGLYQDEWSWTTWHIYGSTIAYNIGAGIYRQTDSYPIYVRNSTIKGNKNSGISGHIGGDVRYSNLYANVPYDFRNMEATDADVLNNWWDTTNETLIQGHIYDYYDDYNLGRVLFKPFLTAPARVPDYIPPMTNIPSRTPESDIQPDQDVRVSVNATDFESGVTNVTLSYNLNDTALWIDLPMTFNATTGLYEVIIPGQEVGTLVKYRIAAYDNAGNHRIEDNSGQYYIYTVIPEFPSILILLLLIITTLIATILSSKKRKPKSQPPPHQQKPS